MTDAGADVLELLEVYARAVFDKDPAQLASLYVSDVRVFDAWGVWSYEQRDAWARNLHEWLQSPAPERVRATFDDVRVQRFGEGAWLSAFVTYSALDADGRSVRSMQNRLTWVLVAAASQWKVMHEHTSVPVDFDHQRAILRRA